MVRWMKDRKTKWLVCPKCKKRELVNKNCQLRLCQSHNPIIQMVAENFKENDKKGRNKTL